MARQHDADRLVFDVFLAHRVELDLKTFLLVAKKQWQPRLDEINDLFLIDVFHELISPLNENKHK